MLTRNQAKLITSLQQKKFRKEENLFIAEGEKVVTDLLLSEIYVREIYCTEEFVTRQSKSSAFYGKKNLVIIEQEELRKISALSTPQHVLALADIPGEEADINYAGGLKLVLDNIKDPGNMGTLIRTADWFGINEVICSEECVDCFNPKVVQGAMGSLFRLKLFSRNLKKLFDLNESKNSLPVYGTVLNGRNIYEEELSKNGFILIGNESVGIEEEHISFITNALTIPASPSTKADSLNAAIAAGIVCSEFFRRK